jgi:hypothetical protein
MKLTLSDQWKQFLRVLQGALFPALQQKLGPMTEKHQKLVAVLSMTRTEALIAGWSGGVGRPAKDRRSMACAFVAKLKLCTTWAPRGSCWSACQPTWRLGERGRDPP